MTKEPSSFVIEVTAFADTASIFTFPGWSEGL